MLNSTLNVDALAQEIRRVDGNHDLGAGALAEALMPFLTAPSEQPEPMACGGCGETDPAKRCLGCMHDFSVQPLYTQPSKQASGGGESALLEVCRAIAPYLGVTQANDWSGLKDDDAISMPVKMRVGDLRALKSILAALSTNEVG